MRFAEKYNESLNGKHQPFKKPIESFIANLIQNTFNRETAIRIDKKGMDYMIDSIMLNCTNMKEQEK